MTEFEITYRGQDLEPAQRPPAQPGTTRMPSDDQALHPVPALVQPWTHGVPPLRPAARRAGRLPTRGGRRFDEIYLAEDESYAGDLALHFERETGMGDIISLTVADFLTVQAVVTNPAKPVTGRQVAHYLAELAASFPPDGFGSAASREAVARVLKMLEES
jgi:hypothetical protein